MTVVRSRVDTLFLGLLLVAIAAPVALLWNRVAAQTGDSPAYLAFCAECTAVYPLFLDAVAALFGTVDAVANIQLVLVAAALAFLGLAVRRAFDAPLAALILVAFLGGWPHLAWLHSQIMTESLFIFCVAALVGSLALLLRQPTWWAAASVSLACGLAITVRPAGASLAPLLAVALWLIWPQCAGRRWAIVAALIAPATLCVLSEIAIWRAHHGEPSRPSMTNRNLLSKVLLIAPAPMAVDPELAQVIAHARTLMAPGRELVGNAPTQQMKVYLLCILEGSLLGNRAFARAIDPLLEAVADVRGQRLLDLQGQVVRHVFMAQPASWFGNALTHYWGQWSSYWMFSSSAESSYRDYVEALATKPLFADIRLLPPSPTLSSTRHWRLPIALWDWAFKWMMLASFAASFAAIGLALWRRFRRGVADRDLALAALCGLGVHGYFLLCGLFSIATDRYTFAMLPMAAVCGTLLVRWASYRALLRYDLEQGISERIATKRRMKA